jgi:hypothetical protein
LKKLLFILFLFTGGFAFTSRAQTDTVINGKHYKIVDENQPTEAKKTDSVKKKKHIIPRDSTFILEGKKLKYYNSWLTAGGGIQQNLTYKRSYGFAGGVDFQFPIQRQYFQLGTVITGEKFGFYDNYQFHLGYGKRTEGKKLHAAGFVGISYSTGYAKVDSSGHYERSFKEPGLYLEGQVVKKLTYDVGAGASIFADVNQEQAIMGIRLIIYFSGAYKGNYVDPQQRVKQKN